MRDLKARYKQTAIGLVWALLQPIGMMAVFDLVLSPFVKAPNPRIPYAVFVYSGLLPWNFLAAGLNFGSSSLVNNASLVRKVYFPRLVFPISAVLAGVVDLVLSLAVLLCLMMLTGVPVTSGILIVPAVLVIEMGIVMGLAMMLAAANAFFRDVRQALPVLTMLWMFLTPVVYPLSRLPAHVRALLTWNPASFPVETFRCALLGLPMPGWSAWALAVVVSAVILGLGITLFRRCEPAFAEII